MGLKVEMKDGEVHRFYKLDEIKRITVYGSFEISVKSEVEKTESVITLEGMEE